MLLQTRFADCLAAMAAGAFIKFRAPEMVPEFTTFDSVKHPGLLSVWRNSRSLIVMHVSCVKLSCCLMAQACWQDSMWQVIILMPLSAATAGVRPMAYASGMMGGMFGL